MRDAAAFRISGLAKRYGARPALRGLDLELPWGAALAVFGPNGAGKTTLLRLLAGLTRPTAGALHVAGVDALRRRADVRHVVGVVTHQTFLYHDLTVAENLRFYARMYGLGAESSARAEAAASTLGLRHTLQSRVRTLSNGTQKRVALARAVLHRPRLLLLDEPEAGLDQEAVELLERLLAEHCASGGSCVTVTHNVEHGLRVADRFAVLCNGALLHQGPAHAGAADDVRAAYARCPGAGA